MPSAIKSARGRFAALNRYREDDDPELIEAQRDLAAEVLAKHVAKVVADAPPMTPEQRDRIAAILHSGVGGIATDEPVSA